MSDSGKKGFLDRIMSEADDTAHPFLQKIQDNIKIILLVVGSVLFIAAAYSLNSFWQERKVNLANAQLEAILVQEEPDVRLTELQAFLSQAPDRMKGAILLEIARTSISVEEYPNAAESFRELARLDPDMRPIALLGRAKAYELMEDYAEALALLKDESDSIPDEFKNQYLTMLSFNAEHAGDYSAALDAYKRLKDLAQGADVGFIDFKINSLRQKISNQ